MLGVHDRFHVCCQIFRSQQLNLALSDEEMHRLEDEADLDKVVIDVAGCQYDTRVI